jgi:hypothetical protein
MMFVSPGCKEEKKNRKEKKAVGGERERETRSEGIEQEG